MSIIGSVIVLIMIELHEAISLSWTAADSRQPYCVGLNWLPHRFDAFEFSEGQQRQVDLFSRFIVPLDQRRTVLDSLSQKENDGIFINIIINFWIFHNYYSWLALTMFLHLLPGQTFFSSHETHTTWGRFLSILLSAITSSILILSNTFRILIKPF